MKKFLFVLFSMFCLIKIINCQDLRVINNEAYQRGEKIIYKVFYDSFVTGHVNAGEASLEIEKEDKIIANRSTMHVIGLGKTKGLFNFFFKVTDRYETYIDEKAIAPLLFIRRVNEGNYKKSQDVTFNHFKKIAISNTKTSNVTAYIQDIISTFYYARTLDVKNVKIGDEFPINFFLDDSVYTTKIVFDGRENIKTDLGTFKCLRFKPMVLSGSIFSQPYPMTLWVSDDKNHVPILAESGILVGSVKMELTKYSGLKNPLSSQIN